MQLTCPQFEHVYASINKIASQEFGEVLDEIYILNDNMQMTMITCKLHDEMRYYAMAL